MAESVEFICNMVDKFSGPAGRIADGAAGMSEALEKMGSQGGKVSKLTKTVQVLTVALRGLQIAGAAVDLVKAFGGLDKVKAGLKSFGRGLAAFGKKAAPWVAAGGGVALIGKGIMASIPAAGGFSLALGGIAIAATGAAAAVGLIGVKAGLAFGKATLNAVRFVDATVRGMRVAVGSTSEAQRVFDSALKLSDKLGLGVKDTVGGIQKLLGKGFSEKDAFDLTKMVGDLSIVDPTANADRLILAISQIKAAGRLQGDELNQLADAGLAPDLVFKQLSKTLGKTVPEIIKLKEAGKLTAETVIPAMMDAVRGLTGMELGELAATESWGIDGIMKRLEHAPEKFFVSIAKSLQGSGLNDLMKDVFGAFSIEGAADGVGGVLRGIVDTLVENKPLIMSFIDGLKAGFGGALEGLSSAWEGIKDAFLGPDANPEKMAAGFKALGEVVGQAVAGFVGLIAVGTGVLGVITAVTGASAALAGKIALLGTELLMGGIALGKNLTDGLIRGIQDGVESVIESVRSLGSTALATLRSVWDSHSPAREFEKIGFTGPLGIEKSFVRGESLVMSAGARLGGAALRGATVSAGDGNGAPMPGNTNSVSVGDIHLHLEGAPANANAEEIADAFHRRLVSHFASMAPA